MNKFCKTLESKEFGQVLVLLDRVETEVENEWIEWNGGKCPVDADTRIAAKFRIAIASSEMASKAATLKWNHDDSYDDITAYKIIEPKPEHSVSWNVAIVTYIEEKSCIVNIECGESLPAAQTVLEVVTVDQCELLIRQLLQELIES